MGAERREREAARWARPSPGAPAAAPTLSLRPGSGGPSASPLGPGRESVASPSEQPPTGARTGGRGAAAACGSGQPPPEDAGWQPRRRPASPTAPPAPPACTRSAGAWASRWTRYSFFVAMGYLTICHISRIYIFHYGILTTDFSGPLMIVTQKITTLAFQVHDGLGRRAEDLSAEQHRLAVKVKPSFLEYLSYLLNFMSVIAGPCNNFKDYIAFIEGRHIHMKLLEVNWKEKGFHSLPEPSPMGAVIHKLCVTGVSLLLFLTLTKTFPVACLADDWFVHKANFLTRLGYLYVVMQASKPKYYVAWTLADAVNNAAGFGFSGVDQNGNFCWDLLSNLNIWKIETATSFKMYLGNWNIQTATWLKRVCYERVPWYPTVFTFILSALWHGVYPGYYFTFLTGILVTVAARTVRNNCRHYFLSSKALKVAYDVATWAATQLAVSYTVAPFVMLAVEPTINLYKSMYFYLHIVSLLIILFLPVRPQAHTQRQPWNSVNRKKTD
ncbi:lysophospholipid acyltransferase 1 isoform X2 [Pipistrellus kuhlii]|uniref:lysophospholipid acyltransferase 1 isoform X2 n=1 Tax=Pipistrellus kuhlii TaxID=59472 RepID=UPI00174F0F0B|nr:lysophospholipid acyltransferase 1 isoform X2 [Pipistrellus kuhlii]